jgi:hypothetical protein
MFRAEMLEKEKAEKEKQNLIGHAFSTWITAGSKYTFEKYLEKLGLREAEIKAPLSKSEKIRAAREAVKKANAIIEKLK